MNNISNTIENIVAANKFYFENLCNGCPINSIIISEYNNEVKFGINSTNTKNKKYFYINFDLYCKFIKKNYNDDGLFRPLPKIVKEPIKFIKFLKLICLE